MTRRSAVRFLLALAVTALALIAPAAASAASQTFSAVADTYVTSSHPTTNYGSNKRMHVKYSRPTEHIFVKFNVSLPSGATATDATLKLYSEAGTTPSGVYVHGVADNTWTESGITYNNAPALGAQIGQSGGWSTGRQYISTTLTTSYVHNGLNSVEVVRPNTASEIGFWTKEAGAQYAPLLVVDYTVSTSDTTPPNTTITSAPGDSTSTSASISFTGTDNVGVTGFECKLDASAFAACTSPKTYSGLSIGSHAFSVRAQDAAGNADPTPATASWTVETVPTQYPLRGMFFRQSNGGYDVIASKGFNLIDSSPSEVDSLASGLRGLTWIGDYNKTACTFEQSDAQITSYVRAHIGYPKVGVWFISDEPWQGGTPQCPNAPAQHAARTALIHSIDPNAKTLIVLDGNSDHESIDAIPAWKNAADYIGVNAYICWQGESTCHYNWIDQLGAKAATNNVPLWGVLQAHGEPDGQGQTMCVVNPDGTTTSCGQTRLPTPSEIHEEFAHWRATSMLSYLVFAWRWPDNAPSFWLENQPTLQNQLAIENGGSPPPLDTTVPSVPTGLTASPGDQQASLSWSASTDPDDPVASYNVYRNTKIASPTGTSYTNTGLANGTTYQYQVSAVDSHGNESAPSGSVSATPQSSGGGTDPFITADGDICSSTTDCAPTATLIKNMSPQPAAELTLGDNAYEDGTLSQYQSFYNPNWGAFKATTRPTTGNHEFHTANAQGYHDYFGITPDYYSYDVGAWHLIALGSDAGISNSSGSAEETWLRNDLAAHSNACTLAYWHEPRWSAGTEHGNDSSWNTIWQDLYNAHAELVLNGHEHHYERWLPQNPSGQADNSNGIVEVVAGTGGAGLYNDWGSIPANLAAHDATSHGVLKITLHAGSYDLKFIPASGSSYTDSYSGTCH